MDNAVFECEYGLANIRVPVLHNVTDDIIFCDCIGHSVESVVVEGRAYTVAIADVEVAGTLRVGIFVYENPSFSRTNWGEIVVKQAIGVFPG